MRYYFLATVDEYGEPTGCIYLDTPGGRVIVLFLGEENEKFRVIGDYAVTQTPALHGIRSMYFEVSSLEEAAREFEQAFPDLHAAVFLTDSHPFVTQLVAALLQTGHSHEVLVRWYR